MSSIPAAACVTGALGVVRWLHHGGFDISRSGGLTALLASLARRVDP